MNENEEVVAEIVEVDVDRPFLTTPFDDYTVVEGLLLLILLILVINWVVKIVKGGFSWLF